MQITADHVADIFTQLASGLRQLHDCGVLHRDLKTDNALIAGLMPFVVKWADLGCSVKLDVFSSYGDDGTSPCD